MAPIKFDRRKKDATDVENRLAPVEIAELIEHGSGAKLPLTFKSLLDAGENPVGYRREEQGTDAIHYTANRGARSLVIAFCAKGGMGVPVSSFLQMMREDIYDVLVLHDQHALFFDRGVVGFSDSFLDTVRRVEAFLSERDYDEIITFGPSMGGYPALRAGLLLGANRAISVGGIFCWHAGRLVSNSETTMAFDVLCPCFAGRDTELVAIASADRDFDSWSLKVVRRTFPECQAVMIDAAEHNLMQYFHSVGLLRLFCACLFEYWREDIRPDLLALVVKAARLGHQLEAGRTEQGFELKRLHASTTWRLTKPLRSLVDNARRLRRNLFVGR